MPKKVNKICKHCKQLRSQHDDWIATGEYAENVVCNTGEMDAEGRYLRLQFFATMDNLEYLEWKAHE